MCFDLTKMVLKIILKTFFRSSEIRSHAKIFTRKVAQKCFGQLWGDSGKNSSNPQKFACSYIYDFYHGS